MQNLCGVDISKDRLDCFLQPDHFVQFENSSEGIGQLADLLHSRGCSLVVMEASGGYERLAFYQLWEFKIPCAIVNARAVRDFAKACGHLEKTDRLDAEVIAQFGAVMKTKAMLPPAQNQRQLSALSARMSQVVSDLVIQKQRLHTVQLDVARQGILNLITLLKSESKTLSAEIAKLIDEDPLWAAIDKTLRSVKGVADRSVATIMADLSEIGLYSNKAIAKLVGLAPIADDSGKRTGKRHVKGGRASVRSILFLVANIVAKFDQSMHEFKQRLTLKGKPKMVVRIALAHKLLVRLNAKVRETRQTFAAKA